MKNWMKKGLPRVNEDGWLEVAVMVVVSMRIEPVRFVMLYDESSLRCVNDRMMTTRLTIYPFLFLVMIEDLKE